MYYILEELITLFQKAKLLIHRPEKKVSPNRFAIFEHEKQNINKIYTHK